MDDSKANAPRQTARLRLRPFVAADSEAMAALHADPEVMRFFPGTLDRRTSDALLARIESQRREDGFAPWAVERLADGAVLGFVGLLPVGFEAVFTPAVEIAWRLRRDAWGHGYATEAARVACDYGFRELALRRILAFTVPDNHSSRAVMERIGMRRLPELNFEHPELPEGHWLRPHWVYAREAPGG